MTQEIVDKLAWLVEHRAEVAQLNRTIESLEKEILELAKKSEVDGKVEFNYAGRSYRASLNTGRVSPRLDQSATLKAIKDLLPEGKQTEEAAKKHLESYRVEKPMKDSVTTREIRGE